jgi:diacylglycerol kinase (ATP)
MRIVAIVNPVSGAGMDPAVAIQRVAMIRDELSARGLTAEIHLTERGGHARELAERAVAARADLAIVWGGDGTVNESGGSLAGSTTALGLIPAGSGNGLAAALRVPFEPRAAIAVALGERTLGVDLGLANGRPFFNVAGIGFDAHVALLFNQRRRGRGGKFPYVVIGVREGCRYAGKDYRITLDSGAGPPAPTTIRALLIAFANGSEYGMGMQARRWSAGGVCGGGSAGAVEVSARPSSRVGLDRSRTVAHPSVDSRRHRRDRRRDRLPPGR